MRLRLCLWLVLLVMFLVLAWKNPFLRNNLISNLEPYPDTLYYSVPAWNLVHNGSFKMMIDGLTINSVVPPLYGILLTPFFGVFRDVRSYYYLNFVLGVVSIILFIKIANILYKNIWITFGLGIVFVTNFYIYNLPSLLMAENLMIPLTLAAFLLIISKATSLNIWLSEIVIFLLLLTKMSALPVIMILTVGTIYKLIKKKELWREAILLGGVGVAAGGWYLAVNLKTLSGGNGDMSWINMARNLPIYARQLMGNGSTYLWYLNPLLEKGVVVLALVGSMVGIQIKDSRFNVLVAWGFVLVVTMFHSMKFYPEGRYISTIVPVVILMFGGIFRYLRKYTEVTVLLVLILYLGNKVTVNGFYERKATTIKRQVMNNFRVENEVPWNYLAVQNFNKQFENNSRKVYLGTLLPAMYVNYFSNQKYNVLPLSETQEFSGIEKGLVEKYYKNDGSIIKLYERLMNEGSEVYISNYYLKNHRSDWDSDFAMIENHFALRQVASGCMDLCKIYKLEEKSKVESYKVERSK